MISLEQPESFMISSALSKSKKFCVGFGGFRNILVAADSHRRSLNPRCRIGLVDKHWDIRRFDNRRCDNRHFDNRWAGIRCLDIHQLDKLHFDVLHCKLLRKTKPAVKVLPFNEKSFRYD